MSRTRSPAATQYSDPDAPSIPRERVAAIVPALNEAARIGHVLTQLTNSRSIDEIIVVDDGSEDTTAAVASSFEHVCVLKNGTTRGKAASMDRGVHATDAPVIFFCDADLQGLTPGIVERIIQPVLEHQYDMFIGLRHNKMQQAVHTFAINSGERALRRELWEELPDFFKTRFRVESGLNHFAARSARGFSYKTFPYSQTLKEVKYGFATGLWRRTTMHFDVAAAFAKLYLTRSRH